MKWVVILLTFISGNPMPNWVFGQEWYEDHSDCIKAGNEVAQVYKKYPGYVMSIWNCVDINQIQGKGSLPDKLKEGTI